MHGFFLENTHIHAAYFLKNTHIDAAALGTANGGAFVVKASQATSNIALTRGRTRQAPSSMLLR